MIALGLIVRALLCWWIVTVAKRKNRSAGAWGFWGFIFPLIALILVYCAKPQKLAA